MAAEGSDNGANLPAPLRAERVSTALASLGCHTFVDSAGDVGWLWSGRLYYMFLLGARAHILQVRGHWNRRISIERRPEILAMCDRWNRVFVVPKVYIRVLDDGFIHVVTEVSAPFGAGATDAQIATCIRNGLAAGDAVFGVLDARFPDPAEDAP